MDRSFLSDPSVISASRKFVCLRLATYESAQEATFLQSIFRGRNNVLENTVFAILAPDGKARLCRTGRSPKMVFRDAQEMAQSMREISRRYPGKRNTKSEKADLPYLTSVRLALNVAACDNLPLIIVSGPKKDTENLETSLQKLIHSRAFLGRILCVRTTDPEDLITIQGSSNRPGILVVDPNTYGTGGTLLSFCTSDAKSSAVKQTIEKGLDSFRPDSKDYRQHIRQGQNRGIHWKTEIPITDSGGRRKSGERPRRR